MASCRIKKQQSSPMIIAKDLFTSPAPSPSASPSPSPSLVSSDPSAERKEKKAKKEKKELRESGEREKKEKKHGSRGEESDSDREKEKKEKRERSGSRDVSAEADRRAIRSSASKSEMTLGMEDMKLAKVALESKPAHSNVLSVSPSPPSLLSASVRILASVCFLLLIHAW